MAPKAKKAAAEHADPAVAHLQATCNHLKKEALNLGILSNEASKPERKLGISKALAKYNGCDIVKRSSIRKNRYLIILNAQLAPAAAGRLGTLTHLDSKNPIIYMDFPLGRLKMLGTLVFPKSKYVVLRNGVGQVLLEDVFETLLVFSEAHWIGKAEDNPDEKPLPFPPELQAQKIHKNYNFNFGAQPKDADTSTKREKEKEGPSACDLSSQDVEAPAAARTSKPRRSAVKRSYAEIDEEEEEDGGATTSEEEEEQEEEADEDVNPGTQELLTQEPLPQPTSRHAAVASPINLASDSEEPPRNSTEKAGRGGGKAKGKAAVKKAVVASQDASGGGTAGRRTTPRRAAGSAASKKLKVVDEDDDEEEEEEESCEDDDEDFKPA